MRVESGKMKVESEENRVQITEQRDESNFEF